MSNPSEPVGSVSKGWKVLMHPVISLFHFSLMDRVAVTGNVKSNGWTGNSWPLQRKRKRHQLLRTRDDQSIEMRSPTHPKTKVTFGLLSHGRSHRSDVSSYTAPGTLP